MLDVEENWVSYLIRGALPESVAVNIGFDDVDGALGVRRVLMLVLPYEAAEAGFPSTDQIDAMETVVQALVPLRDAMGLQEMGWRTGAGRRALCWLVHEGDGQGLAQEVTQAAAQLWERAQCTLLPDAADVVYRDVLAPDAAAWRMIHDGSVLRKLAEHGDIAEEPRKIDHWLVFQTDAQAEACARALRTQGYANFATFAGKEGTDLRCSHFGPATLWEIVDRTTALEAQAEACGGSYDGWESNLVREAGIGAELARKDGWDPDAREH
ncbi:MAG: ribonuclease E inhibitor RraB [Pseudomonadota bacterium]